MGIKKLSNVSMPSTRSVHRVRQTYFNFSLSVSGANNSMHSKNKICLGSEKLKEYENPFIFFIIFETHCVLQMLREAMSINSFWIFIYHMSCHAIFTHRNCSNPIITLPSTIIYV